MFTKIFTEKQKEDIIKRYLQGENCKFIGYRYAISETTIIKNLKLWSISIRFKGGQKQYSCDHNYFNIIDSENKAYWLGFLIADGCVRGNKLRLELSRNNTGKNRFNDDYYHLVKFQKDLETDHIIYIYNKSIIIQICSNQITKILPKYGIHQNKTFTCWTPTLDKGLMKHFWRGVIDGDGCLTTNRASISLTGNLQIIESFKKYCFSIYPQSPASSRPRKNSYGFSVEGKGSIIITKHLYEGANIYLERKYLIYKEMIGE